jgi:hypothetical protein
MANRCRHKSGQERAIHSLRDGINRLKHFCTSLEAGMYISWHAFPLGTSSLRSSHVQTVRD